MWTMRVPMQANFNGERRARDGEGGDVDARRHPHQLVPPGADLLVSWVVKREDGSLLWAGDAADEAGVSAVHESVHRGEGLAQKPVVDLHGGDGVSGFKVVHPLKTWWGGVKRH